MFVLLEDTAEPDATATSGTAATTCMHESHELDLIVVAVMNHYVTQLNTQTDTRTTATT